MKLQPATKTAEAISTIQEDTKKVIRKRIRETQQELDTLNDDMAFWENASPGEILKMMELAETNLPQRIINALTEARYKHVEDVVINSPKTILTINDIGPKSIQLLKEFFKQFNIIWE